MPRLKGKRRSFTLGERGRRLARIYLILRGNPAARCRILNGAMTQPVTFTVDTWMGETRPVVSSITTSSPAISGGRNTRYPIPAARVWTQYRKGIPPVVPDGSESGQPARQEAALWAGKRGGAGSGYPPVAAA